MSLKRQIAGSELVGALERCWDAIRVRHPDVPRVMLIVGSGSEGRGRGLRLGHFAAHRWWPAPTGERDAAQPPGESLEELIDKDDLTAALAVSAQRLVAEAVQLSEQAAATLSEVFIAGEGLARGAEPVFATLLHEAAHGVAYQRQVREVSREGRYHNRRFKQLAEELGLEVERHPQLGWTRTSLPAPTATAYAEEIAELSDALTAQRSRERSPTKRHRRDRNALVAMCGCGRRIRIAPRVLALGPVVCGLCGQPFRV